MKNEAKISAEKKSYCKPAVKVIALKRRTCLLQNSDPDFVNIVIDK